MTISGELTALQQDITNARTAITAKGGTVTSGGGSSQLATDIATIPSGGGGSLVNISPVTSNGTYSAGNGLTVLDSLTFTGNAYVATDIAVPDGCNWDIEAKFKVTQILSGFDKSALFGSAGSSYQVLLNQTASVFYLYMHGEYSSGSLTPVVNTEYTLIKNGSSATLNDRALTKNNDTSIVGGQKLDLFAYAEDGTHSRKFIGVFNYLKLKLNGNVIHWFIPVREGSTPKIYDKVTHKLYEITGTGVTLGNDTAETLYDGFASPLTVNVPAPTKWGATVDDMHNSSVPATPTLHDVVIPSGDANRALTEAFKYSSIRSCTMYGPFSSSRYDYYSMLANNPYLEDVKILRGSGTWSSCGTYTWQYMCNQCTGLKHFYCDALTITSSGLQYICNGCTSLEDAYIKFNPALPYATVSNVFSNTFRDCTSLNKVTFDGLKQITGGSLNFNYTFRDCDGLFDEDINHIRFPTLQQIGTTTGTSTYGVFKNAFYDSDTSYYGKCHLIFPELQYIYNRTSTATNGHFSVCNALGKIYLPKFINDGITGQYIFNSSSYLTEIHCGIENEATVTALAGYTSKFGATNATIYFDMVNHITVGGVVYDRSGEEYDYDTSHYSWKNGTDVIYTTNAIDPAVGDTVYTKSGTTYTSAGTIEAIA